MIIPTTAKDPARDVQAANAVGFEVIAYYLKKQLNSCLKRYCEREAKAKIAQFAIQAIYKKPEVAS